MASLSTLCTGCSRAVEPPPEDSANLPLFDIQDSSHGDLFSEIVDTTSMDSMDATPDQEPGLKPLPPVIEGPDPTSFDCSVAEFEIPDRRALAPLNCPLDPACLFSMIVAHRGAGGQLGTLAPENSIHSIRAALLIGVDGIELDVRHTADDQLVVLHDSSVDRTTNGTGDVTTMTLEEATALHLRLPDGSTVQGDFSCARVPSLAQALALTRDRLFIDLDTKTNRIDLVVAAIEESGLIDQIFVSVGSLDAAIEARTLNPNIRIQVRPDTVEEFEAAVSSFERPPEIFEIPVDLIETLSGPIHDLNAKVFADVWGADAQAYLTDSGAPYLEIFDRGCDIIQTELPILPLKALDRWP